MSWTAAANLARQLADRYSGVRKVSQARMDVFRRQIRGLDQGALTQWLHERLAQEFTRFVISCEIQADADVTAVETPGKKGPPS